MNQAKSKADWVHIKERESSMGESQSGPDQEQDSFLGLVESFGSSEGDMEGDDPLDGRSLNSSERRDRWHKLIHGDDVPNPYKRPDEIKLPSPKCSHGTCESSDFEAVSNTDWRITHVHDKDGHTLVKPCEQAAQNIEYIKR